MPGRTNGWTTVSYAVVEGSIPSPGTDWSRCDEAHTPPSGWRSSRGLGARLVGSTAGVSSNGRTRAFGTRYGGSTPSTPTNPPFTGVSQGGKAVSDIAQDGFDSLHPIYGVDLAHGASGPQDVRRARVGALRQTCGRHEGSGASYLGHRGRSRGPQDHHQRAPAALENDSGCSLVWQKRVLREHETAGSSPATPTAVRFGASPSGRALVSGTSISWVRFPPLRLGK
jgi:hypothetical protein